MLSTDRRAFWGEVVPDSALPAAQLFHKKHVLQEWRSFTELSIPRLRLSSLELGSDPEVTAVVMDTIKAPTTQPLMTLLP